MDNESNDKDNDTTYLNGAEPDLRSNNILSTEEFSEDHHELLHSYSLEFSPEIYNDGITWYKATFLIVNAALGAGLLNFPMAFHTTGGIVAGNIVHCIFLLFALGSLIILVTCASLKRCKTYQEVIKQYCGSRWSIVASVCIALYCFVTCITFIIIIGDQFDRAFASFYGSNFCHIWYMNRKFTMVISSILLIVPSCLKRIDGLQLMSYVGVLSIWYLVVVVVVEMESGTYTKGEVLIWDFNLLKVFNVLPTICFGYQCHVSSIPITSCLRRTDQATLIKACASGIVVCAAVYTISANCGYITFGSLVDPDILLSYDARKPHVLIAVLLLAIKSWTTYPILLFCVREAVSDLYIQAKGWDSEEAMSTESRRRKVIATVLWLASILLAVFTPNLNVVVKLLGSLAAVFILIFPGLCFLYRTYDENEVSGDPFQTKDHVKIFLSFVYIILGFFALGLAFTQGLEDIIHQKPEITICE